MDRSKLRESNIMSNTLSSLCTSIIFSVEGGVRVCGIAVLGYFWCGFAVIFFSKHGNAVFKVQAVRGNFKFYVAVIGEKIVVSR